MPLRPWLFVWRTVRWRDDGTEVHASGEQSVLADSGESAAAAIEKQVLRSLMPPYRCYLASTEMGQGPERACSRAYPPSLPPAEALREWAFEGRAPSAIVAALAAARGSSLVVSSSVDQGPDELAIEAELDLTTTLDRMIALELAFLIDLRELGPVRAFLLGHLSAEGLDQVLAPLLERSRPQWSLPSLLKNEHAEGRSIGPMLREFRDDRGLTLVQLARALRDAFDLSLPQIKHLLEASSLAGGDRALDSALASALEARRGKARKLDPSLN